MTSETFKNSLNHSQKSVYEKLENDIKRNIDYYENLVAALKCIEYHPKKDGTPKANFKMNFGLCAPFGDSFTIIWNYDREIIRYCDIYPTFNCWNEIMGVKISMHPRTKNTRNFNEGEQETPFKDYVDESFYIDYVEFYEFCGFNIRENQDKITPEFIYNAIKNFYLPEKEKALETTKRELEELPIYFRAFIDMANKMSELVKTTKGFTTICHFAHENFDAKEVYYIVDEEFKRG